MSEASEQTGRLIAVIAQGLASFFRSAEGDQLVREEGKKLLDNKGISEYWANRAIHEGISSREGRTVALYILLDEAKSGTISDGVALRAASQLERDFLR